MSLISKDSIRHSTIILLFIVGAFACLFLERGKPKTAEKGILSRKNQYLYYTSLRKKVNRNKVDNFLSQMV